MKMTRLAPQPACARVRQLVAVWLGCVFWLSVSASAHGQVRAELERALTVTRELPGCVSASALRARTAQYLDRVEQLSELTIEVDLQVPQFRVLREGQLLAERRFARAPSDCTERRDALALAVAIAIEQVAEVPAADSGRRKQPTAADERAQRTAASATGSGDPSDEARRTSTLVEPSPRDDSKSGRAGDARSAQDAAASAEPDARDEAKRDGRASADEARTVAPVESDARAEVGRASESDTRSGARASKPGSVLVARGRNAPVGGPRQDEPAGRADEPAAKLGMSSAPALPPSAADRGPGDARDLTSSGRPRARVSLLGGGAVLFEALPTAAAGLSAGAELALLPALRIGLSGLVSLPVSSSFQGGTVSAQLFGVQLTGCVNTPLFASFLLHGCAGAVGGVIQASGDDFALNLSDRMGWIAGLVRARLEYPAAGPVAAGVYADARVNVLRPELQAGLASEPARTRAVGLMGAALGAELIVRLH